MSVFLTILLAIFLTVVFFIGSVIWRVYKSFNEARKHFQDVGGQQRAQETYKREKNYGDQEVIIDRRNPTEKKRQIIPENEGEYVEFEEV